MSIYKKIFEAKKEIGKISKDAKNPFFKSNYLSLNGLIDAVEPVLQKFDLVLLQPIRDGKVSTMILDTEYDGEGNDGVVYSDIQLPNIQDPQKLGSAITYYRRYTLQSLLGLQAEDDDANKASSSVNTKTETDNKDWLNVGSKEWKGAISKGTDLLTLRKYFKISKANAEQYTEELINKSN